MEVFSDDVHLRQQPLRQQISVAFLWEEIPGKPKTEYYMKPTSTAISTTINNSSPPSNNKISASVPFSWEKEPGKPLVQFTNLPSSDNNMAYTSDSEEKEMFKSYLETFLFETHNNAKESSSSGSFDTMEEEACRSSSTSSSVEKDDNTEDGGEVSTTKFFFPLDAKDGGFLRKAYYIQDEGDEMMNNGNKSMIDRNSIVRRRSMTLGELILISRRLSCEKENIIHEHDQQRSFTKDFMKKVSACIF